MDTNKSFNEVWFNIEEILKKKIEVFEKIEASCPQSLNIKIEDITEEFKIKVSYPMKEIADFTVLQQIAISFRDKEGYKKHRLYLQKLLVGTEIKIRVIWAKESRFLVNTDSRTGPLLMSILQKLGNVFGLFSPKVTKLPMPDLE